MDAWGQVSFRCVMLEGGTLGSACRLTEPKTISSCRKQRIPRVIAVSDPHEQPLQISVYYPIEQEDAAVCAAGAFVLDAKALRVGSVEHQDPSILLGLIDVWMSL